MMIDTASRSQSRVAELATIVERITARLQSGEHVKMEEIAREHPEYAAELADLLPAMTALVSLPASNGSDGSGADAQRRAPSQSDGRLHEGNTAAAEMLGDYRILREIGRGGMGIVYEAEQISLGRRVALKVLPFAATLQPRQLERFKNEAKAVASLRHEHIVHVYGVGCDRGVHYYTMQLIDGVTLADAITEMRSERLTGGNRGNGAGRQTEGSKDSKEKKDRPHTLLPSVRSDSSPFPPLPPLPPVQSRVDACAQSDPTQDFRSPNPDPKSKIENPKSAARTLSPSPTRPLSPSAYFRRAAQIIANAASALDHAHSLGIVHRDVKPANLLLDEAGHIWVSDFGLARLGADAGLTISGDLLGTLRYMSPEQALGKHGLVDRRTDVYSLGATLYELVTLQPPFVGAGREELLRQVTAEEPLPPRRLNGAIPAELETIVLKAMAKEPARRYATAADFAADLSRFLAGQPIHARPVGSVERTWRWCQRNPLVASLSAAVIFVATAGLIGVLNQWQLALASEQRAVANEQKAVDNEQKAEAQAAAAKEKAQEANQQRDEAQKQRDEVKSLNDKLLATQEKLQRMLYASDMNRQPRLREIARPPPSSRKSPLNLPRCAPSHSFLRIVATPSLPMTCSEQKCISATFDARFSRTMPYNPPHRHRAEAQAPPGRGVLWQSGCFL